MFLELDNNNILNLKHKSNMLIDNNWLDKSSKDKDIWKDKKTKEIT